MTSDAETPRLAHLPLHDLHTALGARFVEAGGWWLPGDYGDALAEHRALRSAAAISDRSARSRILVTGADAVQVISEAFEGHLLTVEEGRAVRTVALDEAGTIRDLVLIARTGAIAYLVSGEPGQRLETLARLESAIRPGFEARVDDRTTSTTVVTIAGPSAEDVVREQLSAEVAARLQPMQNVAFELGGYRALATRTGDTGEDGFDLMLAPAVARRVLEQATSAGVRPAGRSALEAARVESCIPSWDPDLAPGLSPAEADLDGVPEVRRGRAGHVLAAVLIEGEAVLPAGTSIVKSGRAVGEIRSCVRALSLDATVALAILDRRYAVPGVMLRAAGLRVDVSAKPFYRRRAP